NDTGGGDVLNISESGLATPDTVTVNTGSSPFQISGTAGGGWTIQEPLFNFGGGIHITTGSAGDTVNVLSSLNTGEPITVNAAGGVDTFNVSSTAPGLTGDLNSLDGPLVIDSGNIGGADVLRVSESGLATADTVTIDTGGTGVITGTAGGGWSVAKSGGNFG